MHATVNPFRIHVYSEYVIDVCIEETYILASAQSKELGLLVCIQVLQPVLPEVLPVCIVQLFCA